MEPGWLCRYLLVTPIVAGEWGSAALVIRGWVPEAWRDDASVRQPHQPAGQVCCHYVRLALKMEPEKCAGHCKSAPRHLSVWLHPTQIL